MCISMQARKREEELNEVARRAERERLKEKEKEKQAEVINVHVSFLRGT